MNGVTRREQLRAATDLDIRRHARELLVREGQEAVTLRAIARELGITAPALYRYYDSREDLLNRLSEDICDDLSAELNETMCGIEDDHLSKVFAVCRGFRSWALTHPREFTLAFATPGGNGSGHTGADARKSDSTATPEKPATHSDELSSVFLGVVGPLMAEGPDNPQPPRIPEELRAGLTNSQRELTAACETHGIEMPPEALSLEAVYMMLRWWARLYGQVALEVFEKFPFDVSHADRLFESMLEELGREAGLYR
ncbi:transcriptional regulator, TetR family [Actinopolyspora mzabensis]|uniref:Transcriptional regulator, TetR family n=1 Tax=Actinopolyspora mzabensis TaxID=995066 RepID=A0A1G9FGH7_ACTMZ|nr:TetR/AcrR family transcriptional regulator [Actinopolyspora mzabensis]SDK87462.1 transcriptional regulator, TetR family [Actinopolyspora mzabensis]